MYKKTPNEHCEVRTWLLWVNYLRGNYIVMILLQEFGPYQQLITVTAIRLAFKMSADAHEMPSEAKKTWRKISPNNDRLNIQSHAPIWQCETTDSAEGHDCNLNRFQDERATNCVGQLEQRLWAGVGLMSKQRPGKLTMHNYPEAYFWWLQSHYCLHTCNTLQIL